MKNNKKIGLLIDSLIGGGAERVVLNLAEGFCSDGHDVHIILIKDKIQHDISNSKFTIHSLSKDGIIFKSRFINKLILSYKLRMLIKRIESDGKLFNFFLSNDENMDRLSSKAGLKNRFILYHNSMPEFLKSKIGSAVGLKRIFRKFRWNFKFKRAYDGQNIISICEAQKSEILNEVGIKPKSITVINNPLDFKKIHKVSNESVKLPKQKFILNVARINKRKRQDVLIRAFSRLKTNHNLVLIGDTYTESDKKYLKDLISLVEDLSLRGRISFLGFKKNPYPWIKAADLFVLSSDNEGLSLVLIESLILGTKAISTNCPVGPSEILTGEFSQFLSPPGDDHALALNIEKALVSYPKIDESLIARFSIDSVIAKYISFCCR
jgi:glycosyltransferase involved in cell wall biosynthesis